MTLATCLQDLEALLDTHQSHAPAANDGSAHRLMFGMPHMHHRYIKIPVHLHHRHIAAVTQYMQCRACLTVRLEPPSGAQP